MAFGHLDACDSMMRWIWALRTWKRIQGRLPDATANKAKVAAIVISDFISSSRFVIFLLLLKRLISPHF